MAVDAGIFANALRAPPTVQDFDAQNQAFQQNALALQTARQALTDQNSLRAATMQFGTDPAANRALLAGTGNYKAVQDYTKSMFDNAHTQAQTDVQRSQVPLNASKQGEQDALAANHTLDSKIKATDFHLQQLQGITDLSQIPGWVADGVTSGVQDFSSSKQGLQQFLQSAQQNGLDVAKAQAMKGGQSVAESLKQQQALLIANQQNETSINNNALTNKTHLAGVSMTQAGDDRRAALTRQQQLTMAGMTADGGISPALESEAQLIASGRAAPPSGMAATRPQTAMLMQRVQQINPNYDATSYGAKVKASKDFSTGSQGNAMRSFAVAGQHLDQLGTLVDALNNGNTQIINKIGNQIAEQTGSTAPTNFDAAKDVVSKEVVKAIVAGGGGVAEREELSKLMSNAKSPAQLKGVIQQYRGLMGAQHDALLQQRRAAGLPDSTLPSYTDANGGASAPKSDLHSQADAILNGK